MTNKEMVGIFAYLQTAYPSSEMWQGDVETAIKLWTSIFQSVPVDVMTNAIRNCIMTMKYAPTIAEVNAEIKKLFASPDSIKSNLWVLYVKTLDKIIDLRSYFIYTAIDSNGKTQGENARTETHNVYDALPDILKTYFGSYSGMLGEAVEYDRISDVGLSIKKRDFFRFVDSSFPTMQYEEIKLLSEIHNSLPENHFANALPDSDGGTYYLKGEEYDC